MIQVLIEMQRIVKVISARPAFSLVVNIVSILAVTTFGSLVTGAASAQTELQDPTQPVAYVKEASKEQSALMLQAVFFRESGSQVVINGRLMQVGDIVQNLRVRRIDRDGVQLASSDGLRRLELRPTILSTPEREDQ